MSSSFAGPSDKAARSFNSACPRKTFWMLSQAVQEKRLLRRRRRISFSLVRFHSDRVRRVSIFVNKAYLKSQRRLVAGIPWIRM